MNLYDYMLQSQAQRPFWTSLGATATDSEDFQMPSMADMMRNAAQPYTPDNKREKLILLTAVN